MSEEGVSSPEMENQSAEAEKEAVSGKESCPFVQSNRGVDHLSLIHI